MSEIPNEYPTSPTGARLDPVDNQPVFGELDGVWVSRPRYVELTSDSHRALALQELKDAAAEGDEVDGTPEMTDKGIVIPDEDDER